LDLQERAAFAAVSQIVSDVLGGDETGILRDTPLGSIPGWNSNRTATAIVTLEKTFRRRFTLDMMDQAATIGDIVRLLTAEPAESSVSGGANRFSQFDSLGDSCEFGFAQQEKGIVQPHLLRFSSFLGEAEERLGQLTTALSDDFARLADPGLLDLGFPEEEWDGGRKEYRIINRLYSWQIHTGLMVDSADEEEAREKLHDFPATIVFLRDKFLRALAHGRQTWIWKSAPASSPDRVEALFNALQKHGPNRLLWVLPADQEHPPHTILKLHDGLFKAYIWKSPDPWAGDWSDTKAWSEFLDAVQPVITDGSSAQVALAASQPAAHPAQLDQARALLEEVVSEQLDEPNIRLTDGMMPADIHGWDSLKHVHIILDVEQRLGHTFARDDLDDMQHIGDFVRLIATAMPDQVASQS
jgi:acyl carrier protein